MATDAAALLQILESTDKASVSDDESRAQVVAATRSLLIRLQTPYERFQRYGWIDPAEDAALTTCRNLDLFNKWPKNLEQPMSVAALAESSGASADVLRRICKHLVAMEDLIEVEEDVYRLTDFTASLRVPTRGAAIGHKVHYAVRAIPDWLAKNDYKTPSDLNHSPFQLGIAPEHTWWSWLEADRDMGERFNLIMQGISSEWKNAIELYPVREKLINGFEGGVLMVDLGGGVGHDLETFCAKYSVEGAQYILQDIPSVIDPADPKPPIRKMRHDFFTEQPVKGARSFFLKQIMHDWPDEQATKILSKLRPAMKPGYTKLLIHDIVVPPTKASAYTTGVDLTMMALFGARQRTQADWEGLIKGANLTIEKIWSAPGYNESLLEVVRIDA